MNDQERIKYLQKQINQLKKNPERRRKRNYDYDYLDYMESRRYRSRSYSHGPYRTPNLAPRGSRSTKTSSGASRTLTFPEQELSNNTFLNNLSNNVMWSGLFTTCLACGLFYSRTKYNVVHSIKYIPRLKKF